MLTDTLLERFCAARRAVIAREYSHLNPQQRTAVMTADGPLLLLAGAGSGKTTVLINRIANLIRFGRGAEADEAPDWAEAADVDFLERYLQAPREEDRERAERLCRYDPATPWSILAITFTNKAAGELKSRLEKQLGPAAMDVWAATFHSACARILRREIDRLGFSKDFTIYDTADSERVVKAVLKEFQLDEKNFAPKAVLGYISRAKDRYLSGEEYLAQCQKEGDFRQVKIAQVYIEYQRRLKEASALDFDDIIFCTVKLLEECPEVRDYYQSKFRYVLVDEYQDTNHLQYLLAATLAGRYENICVVGDDDQSIYKFRGATIDNIMDFENQFKGAKVIRLEQNYRSTATILNASNAVIQNNLGRKGKTLWTQHDAGDQVTLYGAMNENDEAQYIAAQILAGLQKGRKENDFAILYRNNAQSNVIHHTLVRNGIQTYIRHPMGSSAEIKDIMAYLYTVQNSADNLRVSRIVNVPPRGIGAKTIETAQTLAAQNETSLYSVIAGAAEYDELQKAAPKLAQFCDMIESLREKARTLPLNQFYEELLADTGYLAALQAKNTPENRKRIDNLMAFQSTVQNYMNAAAENGVQPSLTGFLEDMALDEELSGQDMDEESPLPKEERVQMMTMHSAKGLEFPVVFIVGMEEGIFPGMRAIGDQDEMEEERRLCYVAMTRAKEKLYLTCAQQRIIFGRTASNRPSRFVGEIPPELLDRCGREREEQEDQRREARPKPVSQRRTAADTYRRSLGNSAYVSRFAGADRHPAAASPTVRAAAAALAYHKGDMVEHQAFGQGMILSVQSMGGDALLEIAFDNVGTKRLMLRSAAQHMKKKNG